MGLLWSYVGRTSLPDEGRAQWRPARPGSEVDHHASDSELSELSIDRSRMTEGAMTLSSHLNPPYYRQRCNGGEPHQAPSPPQTPPSTGLEDPSPQPLRLACSRGGESASASSCLWTSAVAVLRAAAVQRGPAHLAPDALLFAEGCREERDLRSWRPANVTPDAAAPFPISEM